MTTSRSHVTKSDWDYDDVNSAYYSNSVWSSHHSNTDPESNDPDPLDKKQDHMLPKNSPSFKSSKTRKQANIVAIKDTEVARPPHANIHIDMVPSPIATTPSSTYTASLYRRNAFHDEPAPHYSTLHRQMELQQMEEYTKTSFNKDVAAGEETVTPTVSTAGSTGEGTGTKVTGGNTNLVSTTNATMPSQCPTLIESNFHMAPPLTDKHGYLIQPLEIHLIPESPPSVTPPKSVATDTVFSITSIQIPVETNGKDDILDVDIDGKEDAGKPSSSGAHKEETKCAKTKKHDGSKERDDKKSKSKSHDKKEDQHKKSKSHKSKSNNNSKSKKKKPTKIDKVKLRETVREKRKSYHDSKRDLLLPLTDQDSGNVMQEPAPLPIPKPEELQQIYAQWNAAANIGNVVGCNTVVGNKNGCSADAASPPPPLPMMNASNPSVATHKISNHQNSQWSGHRHHNSARSLLTATMGAAGRRHSHSHQHPPQQQQQQQRQSSSLRRLLTQTNAAIKTNPLGYGRLSFAERSNGNTAAAAKNNNHKTMVGSFRGISVGNRQPPEGGSIRLSKSSQGVLVLEEDSSVEHTPPPLRTRPQLSPKQVDEALQQRAMELELHFAHIKETASAVQENDGSEQERQDEEVESDNDEEDDDEEDVGEEIFTTSHASGNLSQRLLAIRRHNKSTEDMDGLQYTHKEDYSSVHSKSIRSKASAKKKKKKKSKTEPHHVQDSQQGSRMKKTRGQHDDSPGDAAPVLPSTGYQRDSSKESHPTPPREVKVRPSMITNHHTHRSSSRSHLSAPAPPATHHSARNLKDPLPNASKDGRKQMHSLNVVASSQPVDLDNDSSVISAPPPPYLPTQLPEDQPEAVDASRCLPRSLRDNVVLRFFSFAYMYMVAPLVRGRGSGNKKSEASDGRNTQGNINDLMMPTDHTSSYAVDEDEHAIGVEQPRPQVRHSSRSDSRCCSPDTNDVIYV